MRMLRFPARAASASDADTQAASRLTTWARLVASASRRRLRSPSRAGNGRAVSEAGGGARRTAVGDRWVMARPRKVGGRPACRDRPGVWRLGGRGRIRLRFMLVRVDVIEAVFAEAGGISRTILGVRVAIASADPVAGAGA